jgi:sulfur carrier protein
MLVTVNGEARELPTSATVASVVELLADAADGRGIAVAVDDNVVPRSAWDATELRAGARVEVLAAVQGG